MRCDFNTPFIRAILSGCMSVILAAPAFAAGSFAGFAGNWRGSGTITLSGGGREQIHCKGTYAVRADSAALNINLLCASDSYKVNIISDVRSEQGGFAGQWQETTKQVQGDVNGSFPGPGQLQATLEGPGFGMQFSAKVSGNRQAVTLQGEGIEVQSVEITMSR